MGLDMGIRRVKKPKLEDKIYTTEELSSMGYSFASVEGAENDELLKELLPYTVTRNVLTDYYDVEKMIVDYNLPPKSHIGMYSNEGISISGRNDNDEYVGQFISRKDIEEKYTITKLVSHYIWHEEEEAYWRKHYELQDWFYNVIEGVDNCGYYILNADVISEMNQLFHENVAEEDPTEDEALFYHEWY